MNILDIKLFNILNDLSINNDVDEIKYCYLKIKYYNDTYSLDKDILLLFSLGIINIKLLLKPKKNKIKIIVFNKNRRIVNYKGVRVSFNTLADKTLNNELNVFVENNNLFAIDKKSFQSRLIEDFGTYYLLFNV